MHNQVRFEHKNEKEIFDMDTIKMGKFLKELRKEKGLTQEQLGEKIGVTNKTVSRWENGNMWVASIVLTLLIIFLLPTKELNLGYSLLLIFWLEHLDLLAIRLTLSHLY